MLDLVGGGAATSAPSVPISQLSSQKQLMFEITGHNLILVKGTVHQMYECCSEVLLHLGRMFGIVFMVQRGQIWPKNTKTCFDKMYPVPLRSAAGSFKKCRQFL